jgi:hypothetical protein
MLHGEATWWYLAFIAGAVSVTTIFTFFWHLKPPTKAWFFSSLGDTVSIESGWIIFHPTIWPADLGQWVITLLVAGMFLGTVSLNALTSGSALAELQLRANLGWRWPIRPG